MLHLQRTLRGAFAGGNAVSDPPGSGAESAQFWRKKASQWHTGVPRDPADAEPAMETRRSPSGSNQWRYIGAISDALSDGGSSTCSGRSTTSTARARPRLSPPRITASRSPEKRMGSRICGGMVLPDKGTEQTIKAILKWQKQRKVEWPCVALGKSMHNSAVESFDDRLRTECLTEHLFTRLRHDRRLMTARRNDDKHLRRHLNLSGLNAWECQQSSKRGPKPAPHQPVNEITSERRPSPVRGWFQGPRGHSGARFLHIVTESQGQGTRSASLPAVKQEIRPRRRICATRKRRRIDRRLSRMDFTRRYSRPSATKRGSPARRISSRIDLRPASVASSIRASRSSRVATST